MNNNDKLPLHTRLGACGTIAILIVLTFFLLRNCVRALYYGSTTSDIELSRYYDTGLSDGMQQHLAKLMGENKSLKNPLLTKAYLKGFRHGRDLAREKKKEKDKI